MPELRWILLALGLALIVGVFLWSRYRGMRRSLSDPRREPVLDSRSSPWEEPEERRQPGAPAGYPDELLMSETERTAAAVDAEPGRHEVGEAPEQLIIALRLRARAPEGFSGGDLLEACRAERLEHGKFGAFHGLDDQGRSRFLIASLVEPGEFDPETMPGEHYLGVSLFMVLPGPKEPLTALDGMLACGRRLARRLDGELLDEKGTALTVQEAAWLREQVVEYQRRTRLGAIAGRQPGGQP